MVENKKIYVLESRHYGSNQQLIAVARYVFEGYELVNKRIELRSRSKLLRALCRIGIFLKENIKSSRFGCFISWIFLKNGRVKVGDLDVIVAKTPPFEYPAALLSAGTKAKIVFLGAPKHFPRNYFDIIVSTPSTFCSHADIVLETLPTRFHEFLDLDNPSLNRSCSVWALILGGNAKGYLYDEVFYDCLCKEMIRISDVLGVKWIISSSPRTGCMAEKVMMEFSLMHPERVEECGMWGKGKRLSLGEVFNRSEMVLITEDSASMISEAVNHRVKTICVRPEVIEHNGLVAPLLQDLERKKRVLRVSLSQMSRLSVDEIKSFEFQPLQESWVEAWERQSRLIKKNI